MNIFPPLINKVATFLFLFALSFLKKILKCNYDHLLI